MTTSGSDSLLLPEGAWLVRVGPYKTGTTAIQVALHHARADLAQHRVLYAGVGPRPRQAGWALGIGNRWAGVPRPLVVHWLDLVREVEEAMPRTFERLLGLPDGLLVLRPERSNRGLSWSEVELVRELNQASKARGWPRALHHDFVQRRVVRTLRSLPPSEIGARTPPLPAWAVGRVRELSDARVELIEKLGVRVVGDPEVLRLPAEASVGSTHDCPPMSVEMAARAIESVIVEARKRSTASRRLLAASRKAAAPTAVAVVPSGRIDEVARRVARRIRSARS